MTTFVPMYHPGLPGTPHVLAPQDAEAAYAARGWLVVDGSTPVPTSEWLSPFAGDLRYLKVWTPNEAVTAGAVRVAPDGHVIVRTANGTARASYDSTEQAAWTVVSGGGGAVASVVGQTGAVTGTQIAADAALRAAYVPKWKPSTAYASGEPVLNPSGQIVTANSAFTSGASYNAANWTVVSGGGGTPVTVTDHGTYATLTVG